MDELSTIDTRSTMTASAVVVVETDAPSAESLLRLLDLVAARFDTVEIVLVANDVAAEVGEALADLVQRVPDVTIHFLMNRIDFHAARLVGIDNALGDWVLLTSASPEELDHVQALLARAGGTVDLVVVESGAAASGSRMRSAGRRGFIRLCRSLTGIEVESSDSTLRLLSRAACQRIVNDPHGELLVRAVSIGSGMRTARLHGRYPARAGRRRYRIAEELQRGIGTLVQSSVLPLRIVSLVSLAVAGFALVYSLYVIGIYLFKSDVAPGWTTLSLQISILMLSSALMLWLIAEYVLVVRSALPPRRRIPIARELRSPLTRRRDQLNVVNEEGRPLMREADGGARARAARTSGDSTRRQALIGYTGFVGSNLDRADRFTDRFNSRNSTDLTGAFDLVVCAGVSAVKWVANRDPEADWQGIERLISVLDRAEVREFVLISTVDVYPEPARGEDESASIDGAKNHAYGRNRLRLEEWVAGRFPGAHVVRLPALFGPGLKKNALYDLLHDNQVEKVNAASQLQWYPIERLWTDLERIRAAGITLVNLVTEPVSIAEIAARHFPAAPLGGDVRSAQTYRVRTRHAPSLGGRDGFVMPASAVLDEVGRFIAAERAVRA